MSERKISVSRVIQAPAGTIFDVLADPGRHHEFDGSGTVQGARSGAPERLALGTKFGMSMRLGLPYAMSSTVVEFEEDRLIAWAHVGRHRWRYELEPLDDATEVTETFDWSTALFPPAIEWMGWPKRHPANMERTLERLDALVTG